MFEPAAPQDPPVLGMLRGGFKIALGATGWDARCARSSHAEAQRRRASGAARVHRAG